MHSFCSDHHKRTPFSYFSIISHLIAVRGTTLRSYAANTSSVEIGSGAFVVCVPLLLLEKQKLNQFMGPKRNERLWIYWVFSFFFFLLRYHFILSLSCRIDACANIKTFELGFFLFSFAHRTNRRNDENRTLNNKNERKSTIQHRVCCVRVVQYMRCITLEN